MIKPEHKQKIDELILALSKTSETEDDLIASILCVLQATIIMNDVKDFCRWVNFYNRQMIDQFSTKGGKDGKAQEKVFS